ncbi:MULTISPECIES: CdaR family transcriptional regulator [Clostridia]|jgi:carbohydrate diacid regulator|uniref:CdaR family transcriptional regulator n=1 Tax=Clostridia TaxID=186801 RepID=UPI0008338725|nr:sugar diacid recognition domain-containing protein [Clostridium sp. AT4]
MITKVSRRLAQQIVDTVKDVCGRDINFIAPSGTIFASTDKQRIGEFHEIGQRAAKIKTTIEVQSDGSFQGTQKGVNIPIFHQGILLAVIGISGPPEEVRKFGYLALRITDLLIREQELAAATRSRQEKIQYLVHSLIHCEETDPSFLENCLEEFQLSADSRFLVCCIRLNERYHPANISMFERDLRQLLQSVGIAFSCFEYPREYIALIPEDEQQKCKKRLMHFASIQKDILSAGLGTACNLPHLYHSYREALTSLGAAQFSEIPFCCFEELDIEILLNSINPDCQKDYLQKTVSGLNEDDFRLLQVYYDENMSLTNTGSRLFLHKNTLQYKLKRIAKITGYDPRIFRDAVSLYLGLKIWQKNSASR